MLDVPPIQELRLLVKHRVRRQPVSDDIEHLHKREVPHVVEEPNLNCVRRKRRMRIRMLNPEHERSATPDAVLDWFDSYCKLGQ